MNRVVLDTNVVVSGLLFGGPPGRIATLWKAEKISPVISKDIAQEYLRVLSYPKFALSESEIEFIFYDEILAFTEVIEVPESKEVIIGDDPSDDKFLHCAVHGGVGNVVSGDVHLLNLKRYSGVEILSAREFLSGGVF